jgi:hypothetical protein
VSGKFPNLLTKPTMRDIALKSQPQQDTNASSKPRLSASMASDTGKITSLANGVDLRGELSAILSSGCKVHLHALSPFNNEIHMGKGHSIILNFPIPVAQQSPTNEDISYMALLEPERPASACQLLVNWIWISTSSASPARMIKC